MCPYCRQNAPVVYRGIVPYCTACGRMRVPLTGRSLHHAGQGSKMGAAVAQTFGWLVLVFGLCIAMGGAAIGYSLFGVVTAALAFGLPVGVLSAVIGVMLLRGGRSLERTGSSTERATREQAIYGLAANRGGALTARDVAQALEMREEDADALLTEMAKQQSDRVSLEVDDNGGIWYRFIHLMPRQRVDEADANAWRARVATPGAAAPAREVEVELVDEVRRARQAR